MKYFLVVKFYNLKFQQGRKHSNKYLQSFSKRHKGSTYYKNLSTTKKA